MSTYLETLTFRLAAGMNQLPEAVRAAHATFLLNKQNADGGFSGREGPSDLYYTGFALRGLAITGELDGPVAEQAAEFLKGQLAKQAAIIDFLSLLYGALLLETSAGIDLFAEIPDGWQLRVAEAIEQFRRDDGGYAMSSEGASSSTYYTFLVLLCRQLIGVEQADRDQLVKFILSRQRDDGGFVEKGPMRRSGTNPTAAAVGVLRILDAVPDAVRQDVVEFLAERQNDEGGLAANTRIPFSDVLSTFTGLLTLGDLAGLQEIDIDHARRFVTSMQAEHGGFRAGELDQVADVEYTFYGLGALALLADVSE